MSETTVRYAIVTPARDEVAHIGALAHDLLVQTVPFTTWIVVDDGSTDGTAEIVRAVAARDSRVYLVERPPRAERRVGFGGIESTVIGIDHLGDLDGYDFVANIDADVSLPPDYFSKLFAKFAADPELGIAGGHCYSPDRKGALRLERVPEDHVHGATKVYRSECLQQIGPLAQVWGWDAVDEGRAQLRGWRTRSFDGPTIVHRKPMSGGTGRVLHGKYVFGRTCHFLGYRADFALLRAAMNLARPPYVLGGLAMAWGYLSGVLLGAERLQDPEFVGHLRARQADRLKRALSRLAPSRGRAER